MFFKRALDGPTLPPGSPTRTALREPTGCRTLEHSLNKRKGQLEWDRRRPTIGKREDNVIKAAERSDGMHCTWQPTRPVRLFRSSYRNTEASSTERALACVHSFVNGMAQNNQRTVPFQEIERERKKYYFPRYPIQLDPRPAEPKVKTTPDPACQTDG